MKNKDKEIYSNSMGIFSLNTTVSLLILHSDAQTQNIRFYIRDVKHGTQRLTASDCSRGVNNAMCVSNNEIPRRIADDIQWKGKYD